MTKFLLLFVTSLAAVIHLGLTAEPSRMKEEKISFVDDGADPDAIRERIRTEMDNYKRMKEMMLKMKKTTAKPAEIETSSATAESTTATITVVESSAMPIAEPPVTSSEAPKEEKSLEITHATSETPLTSSEAPLPSSTPPSEGPATEAFAVTSSTLRPVFNPDLEEDEDAEEGPVPTEDETTLTPGTNKTVIDDRFIINAPTICKDGKKADHSGKCRKIVR